MSVRLFSGTIFSSNGRVQFTDMRLKRIVDSNRRSRKVEGDPQTRLLEQTICLGDSRLRFQSREESSARFSCRCSQALCSGICFSQKVLWQYSHSILRGDSVPHSAHLITAPLAPEPRMAPVAFKRVLELAAASVRCPIPVLTV